MSGEEALIPFASCEPVEGYEQHFMLCLAYADLRKEVLLALSQQPTEYCVKYTAVAVIVNLHLGVYTADYIEIQGGAVFSASGNMYILSGLDATSNACYIEGLATRKPQTWGAISRFEM